MKYTDRKRQLMREKTGSTGKSEAECSHTLRKYVGEDNDYMA